MISLHDAVVPTFLQLLASTGRMLAKAERHCADTGLAAEALLSARLAPDMWDCATQVYTATLQSAGALEGALAGQFAPAYPPVPAAFAPLQAMVSDAITRIKAIPPQAVEALAGRTVSLRSAGPALDFLAPQFLTGFALPNFTFHVGTAYAILRSQGVPLGKADFLGRIPVLARQSN